MTATYKNHFILRDPHRHSKAALVRHLTGISTNKNYLQLGQLAEVEALSIIPKSSMMLGRNIIAP